MEFCAALLQPGAFEQALVGGNTGAVENRGEVREASDGSLWEPLLSLLLCCSCSSRASSSNAGTSEIQEKFASSQDAFDDVVKYFGENPKTTPPSVFFPVFVRFVKAYKVNRSFPGHYFQAGVSQSWA